VQRYYFYIKTQAKSERFLQNDSIFLIFANILQEKSLSQKRKPMEVFTRQSLMLPSPPPLLWQ